MEKNKPYENGNVQILGRIEKQKRRHLGGLGNVSRENKIMKTILFSEESKEEVDMEKPQRCNEERHWL